MSGPPPIEISLSRIAHDLRGPLMPLRTAAWLLRNEEGESPRVCELADIVDRQSMRLAKMMDELSDWGRTAGNQMSLTLAPVEALLAVDMAIGSIPRCQVEPSAGDDVAEFPLQADPHRLGQLLRTLIEHAMHRDPEQRPDVALSVGSDRLHILVRDHGAAVDAVARDALLSRPQANPFDEGLGLRLLLARRIAEAHGGSLLVDEAITDGLGLVCALPRGG